MFPPRRFHSGVFGRGEGAGELSTVRASESDVSLVGEKKERWREVITQPEMCGSLTVR